MYNIEGTEFFLRAVEEEFGGLGGLRGKRMLEIGNQHIWQPFVSNAFPEVPRVKTAKEWFESIGVEHVSVDMNGEDGALPLDLTRSIDRPEWWSSFDVMTNEGTLEHMQSVVGVIQCLKTVHECVRPGGLIVHALPPPPTPERFGWTGHCRAFFTEEFVEVLAKFNGYDVLRCEVQRLDTLGGHVDYISAALRKGADRPFMSQWGRLRNKIVWV